MSTTTTTYDNLITNLRETSYRVRPDPHKNERLDQFVDILRGNNPNLNLLRGLCFHGLPDEYLALRSVVWKLVLRYLPPEKSQWDKVLSTNLEAYLSYCNEFISEPITVTLLREGAKQIERQHTHTHTHTHKNCHSLL
eukprot:GHVR01012461.1.p1 GENE.GHVR01012461.1~~GHVR01012461.1.p1  ORF type:complete len:138 (-),score=33.46 GHVR01012461.1:102-515(-)